MTPDEYTTFIKSGLNVGFTDDQIDFLAIWIEKIYELLANSK